MKTEFERYYWICDAPGCYFVREHGVNFHLAKCTTQHTAEMIVNALYSDQQNKEKDAEIQRLKNDFNEAVTIAQANRNEIQRLTKEVEEYKVVVKNYDKIGSEKTETITSLRDANP